MEFSSDSNTLVIASADATVQFLHIHDDGAVTIQNTLAANTGMYMKLMNNITKCFFYILVIL